jgi:hypothetical protein
MHYAWNLQQPSRSLALLSTAAALLGAGAATATFALVNIEDESAVSPQTRLAQPAVASNGVAPQARTGTATDAGRAAVGIPSPAAAAKMSEQVACSTDAVGIPSPAAAAKMNDGCGVAP